MYDGALRAAVSQGDIFRDVAFVRVDATGSAVTSISISKNLQHSVYPRRLSLQV